MKTDIQRPIAKNINLTPVLTKVLTREVTLSPVDLAWKAQCEVQRSAAQATTIPFGTGLVSVIRHRYLVDTGGSAERVFRHGHQGLYLKPSIAPPAVSSFYIKASNLTDFIYFYVSPSTSYNTLWPHSKEDLASQPSMAKLLNPPLLQLPQIGNWVIQRRENIKAVIATPAGAVGSDWLE